jgi:ferritin-like metal-binding protein YciE
VKGGLGVSAAQALFWLCRRPVIELPIFLAAERRAAKVCRQRGNFHSADPCQSLLPKPEKPSHRRAQARFHLYKPNLNPTFIFMALFGLGEKFNTLQDLYVHLLKDLYSAEKQLTKALPKMAEAAISPDLKQAFLSHLRETENQIARLETIAAKLGASLTGYTCHGMKGIISEGRDWAGETAADAVKDAGLIMEAQHAEHYEIAGYGSARTYAELLGHPDAASLLQTSLDEEVAADAKLNALASRINVVAA